MADNPTDIIEMATDLIESEGGFAPFVQNAGLGGIFMALVLQIILLIQNAGALTFGLIGAFADGFIGLIDATFGGLQRVWDSSTIPAIESFTSGSAAILGPFAPILGISVVMATVWVFLWFIGQVPLNPLQFIQGRRR